MSSCAPRSQAIHVRLLRTDVECIPSPFTLSILLPQDERLGLSGSVYRNTLIPASRDTKSKIGVRERRFRVDLLYWQGPASICWYWPGRYREGCREPGE